MVDGVSSLSLPIQLLIHQTILVAEAASSAHSLPNSLSKDIVTIANMEEENAVGFNVEQKQSCVLRIKNSEVFATILVKPKTDPLIYHWLELKIAHISSLLKATHQKNAFRWKCFSTTDLLIIYKSQIRPTIAMLLIPRKMS